MKTRVIDASDNSPISGVTVSVNGSPVGQTDTNGEINFNTPNAGASISFSHVNYQTENNTTENTGTVQYMTRKTGSVPEVVIGIVNKRNNLLLLAVLAVGVFFFLKYKKII